METIVNYKPSEGISVLLCDIMNKESEGYRIISFEVAIGRLSLKYEKGRENEGEV